MFFCAWMLSQNSAARSITLSTSPLTEISCGTILALSFGRCRWAPTTMTIMPVVGTNSFPMTRPLSFKANHYLITESCGAKPGTMRFLKQDSEQVSIRLWRYGSVTQTVMEKSITLRRDEPMLRFHHRLTNLSDRELFFLW